MADRGARLRRVREAFLGTGVDEFRRVLNAGLSLTVALALISYAVNSELSRLYLVISMQVIVCA